MSKYDVALEKETDSISGKILGRIRQGSCVLEFGCAEGRMTRYMKERLGCRVTIVELDAEAYAVARKYAEDGLCGDIETGEWAERFAGKQFDYILFADVLEHLRDPEKALAATKGFLKPEGEVLLSLPNIGHNDVLANLFLNRFEYTSTGLLDNTHVHFWGKNDLPAFAERTGYEIRVLDGVYQAPFHSEQRVDRGGIPAALTEALARREYNEVYQFFLVLRKKGASAGQSKTEEKLKSCGASLAACFYWDQGEGYQAGNCVVVEPTFLPGGAERFYCGAIPENCVRVRFDPVLGASCVVSDIHVQTNVASCEVYPLNGVTFHHVSAFANTDPQMEFSLPAGSKWVEVLANVRVCAGYALEELLTAVQILPAYERLREDLLDMTVQRDGCRRQLEQSLQQAEKYRGELEQSLQQAQGRAASMEEQLQIINGSQFWRMTKPFRRALDAVKRTRAGSLLHKTAHSLIAFGPAATLRKIRDYGKDNGKDCEKDCVQAEESLPAEKTGLEYPIDSLAALAEQIVRQGGSVFGRLCMPDGEPPEKLVLLVAHQLGLTGAPVAVGYMAESLKRLGYFPVLLSPCDGELRQQLTGQDIPVMVYGPVYQSDVVPSAAHLFTFVVLCTNVGAPLAAALSGTDVPVVWWIHEAAVSYHPGALAAMPETLADNIQVYCGGGYAEEMLKRYRPRYQTRQLLYYVPDFSKDLPAESAFHLENADGKTVFAIVGLQEERKGQDILVQAIRLLPPEKRKGCLFVFVGKPIYDPIRWAVDELCEEYPENVTHIPELSREGLFALYGQIDCLICASKDDPMPIVVTEAMVMSKTIICSENTGSAGILEGSNAGLIYRENSPLALERCIEYVCDHKGADLQPMCERARTAYERYFSQAVFDANVAELCRRARSMWETALRFEGTVSVVVPTYNGGEDIKRLLDLLQRQEGVGRVEIIVVDSGSRDGTPELAEQAGAKVIRIPNEAFSHSYARNLGAAEAEGEYVLFMTQDALPDGTGWISGLLQPALRDGVAAVSCRETPKPGCDLIGRLSIWIHSEYMGILSSGRIMQMPDQVNYETLRRNGQLNDVTCLVRRDVFQAYQYRGDYAEDLDLGIRLIRSGHRLALLSRVCTIHSHTRPAFYHLRRGLVDFRTLKSILPDLPIQKVSEQTVVDRLVTAYCADVLYLRALRERMEVQEDLQDFCDWTEGQFHQALDSLGKMGRGEVDGVLREDVLYTDDDLRALVRRLYEEKAESFAVDGTSVIDQSYYITHSLLRYLSARGERLDGELKREIGEMIFKLLGQLAGNLLAMYCIEHKDEESLLNGLEPQLSAGV